LNIQGKHAEALAAAEEATRLDPRNSANYKSLQGQAFMGLERWREAIAARNSKDSRLSIRQCLPIRWWLTCITRWVNLLRHLRQWQRGCASIRKIPGFCGHKAGRIISSASGNPRFLPGSVTLHSTLRTSGLGLRWLACTVR